MHYYEVAPNQIIRPTSQSFTYKSDTPLETGSLVTIEIGKKQCIGVVLHEVQEPKYKTKNIEKKIEETALPNQLIELALWISDYYKTHLATTLQTILPSGLTKKRRQKEIEKHTPSRKRTIKVFTDEQLQVIDIVTKMPTGSSILHGVTGSGKTTVYIELTRQCISSGKSVIVLIPEISLTSQIVDEFSHHFDDIIISHSRQTEPQRHLSWKKALESQKPIIVVGPRSALFLPISKLGLVIIDEAHEPSFKQEQSPRYSALRAASVLCSKHGAKLLLGSATPSITDYYLAEKSQQPIIRMRNRANKKATPPTIELIDMKKRENFSRHRFLSNTLITQIENSLSKNKQSLIFHNRRGSTSTTLCKKCGWTSLCPRCFIPQTLHSDKYSLTCHVCNHSDKVPTSCPICKSADIIHKGIGTKLIESELKLLFPDKRIARFDADTNIDESLVNLYKQIYDGSIDIIIGTQVIAKGLDLPNLRTVGVIQADTGLSLPDYGSSERVFQLLAQVVGRVGRFEHETNVIVQSYQPNNSAVVYGLNQDYDKFYSETLKERKRSLFPPFTHLLKLTCIYKTEEAAIKNSKKVANELKKIANKNVQILGPAPSFYEQQYDTYRWQLIIKSPIRSELTKLIKFVPSSHWQIDLDPSSLL